MQRYRVKLLRYKSLESFVIYLSAACDSEAYIKARNFLLSAYGFACYYLIYIKKERA